MLIFVIPFILQMFFIFTMISNLNESRMNQPEQFFDAISFMPLIMAVYIFGLMGWFYSIAIGLQRKIPEPYKMKINRFKIFFYIPVVYISVFIFAIVMMFGNYSLGLNVTPNLLGTIFALVVPIHIFSAFCMFYIMYFVSKTIKTVELQREVTFSDYAGEFFMLWFYFIGVWILQPKINKMADLELKEQPISSRPR